jgi:membrane protein
MRALHELWVLLKQTVGEWADDRVPQLGAALAFYTALSIAPLLVLSLRVAAFFFGDDAARGEVDDQLKQLMGPYGAAAIQEMLASARRPELGTTATILSIGTLLFAASSVFVQLQDSMNTICKVRTKPGRGIIGLVRDRFFSFTGVAIIACLLLVSLVISAVLASLHTVFDQLPDFFDGVVQRIDFGVSFAVVWALFALMFKMMPDVRFMWRDVWLGALVTAVLFTIGKLGISLYVGRSGIASSYGVAGSFVVLLVWVYYSAQIFYFGAELTQVYAVKFGGGLTPKPNAERITREEASLGNAHKHAPVAHPLPPEVQHEVDREHLDKHAPDEASSPTVGAERDRG